MRGKTDWDVSNHLRNTETLTEPTVSRWTSSGIFSQDSITLQLSDKVKSLPVDQETMKKECMSNANLVSQNAKKIWKRTMVIYWSWF